MSNSALKTFSIIQLLANILRLFINNSFVLIGPLSGFLITLVLAKLSDLEADKIYFLVLGLLAFSSLVDGGLAFMLSNRSSGDEIEAVLKKVVRNLQIFGLVPPVILAFMLSYGSNALDAFGELFLILVMTGVAAILKILGDSLRVIGMKSARRNTVDRASSALAVVKVLFAYLFVNELPFLYTYTVLLAVELILLSYLQRDKVRLGSFKTLKGGSFFKFHYNSAYLLANLGYVLGFNVDRLLSFYHLNALDYKTLIVVIALLNMSILPNKLIENTYVFPTDSDDSKNAVRLLKYIFPLLGIVLACVGFLVFIERPSWDELIVLSMVAVIWVPVTIYFNNLWALHLNNGGSIDFAKVAVFSGLLAAFIAICLSALYQLLIPVGLFVYSLTNAVLVYILGQHKKGLGSNG